MAGTEEVRQVHEALEQLYRSQLAAIKVAARLEQLRNGQADRACDGRILDAGHQRAAAATVLVKSQPVAGTWQRCFNPPHCR